MKKMLENVRVPASARCEDSLAVLWDKPSYANDRIKEYKVFVNGICVGDTKATDYTIEGLEPLTEYEIFVQSINKNGTIGATSKRILAMTKKKAARYNIESYGAKPDAKTLNTNAIQQAIDACEPGGMVIIPKGVFKSGAIYLKSNMTLYLEEGAVLLGSENPDDYPVELYRCEGNEVLNYASLINPCHPQDYLGRYDKAHEREIVETGGYLSGASRLHDITIEGKGTIDANGMALMKAEFAQKKARRGRAISLRNVDRVYLKGITVRQSPAWCIHLSYCSDLDINGIEVHTRYDENGKLYGIVNCDGINPDSCENVNIYNCLICSGDDSIALKSGWNEEGREVGIPTQNVRITNCRFKGGFGVAVGSEMAGGIRNVLVQDCEFENTYSVASIKAPRGRGGVIENIRYEDISFSYESTEHTDCRWFRGAIYVDQFYSYDVKDEDLTWPVDETTPKIKNLVFRNIRLKTIAGHAIYLAGLPEAPMENVFLDCIQAEGKTGLYAENINGLNMRIVNVKAEEGENYQFHRVNGNTFSAKKFD